MQYQCCMHQRAEAHSHCKLLGSVGSMKQLCLYGNRLGGSDLPRPWSKYTEGSSRFKAVHEQEAPAQPLTVREQKKLQKAMRGAAGAAEEEGAAAMA